ncbi:hypothetical protein BB559_006475 [Furculomyces boomerangus]|uniref:Extracellular membrane protein CFEM domain-containing protein n=1 Tax=Furculomyces boomerangus TaxID=61424 RepID=A0A2T9Y2L2_9FUNG|nr:hypothetical protein BB559_006475 [Furculomyces boomerangus]
MKFIVLAQLTQILSTSAAVVTVTVAANPTECIPTKPSSPTNSPILPIQSNPQIKPIQSTLVLPPIQSISVVPQIPPVDLYQQCLDGNGGQETKTVSNTTCKCYRDGSKSCWSASISTGNSQIPPIQPNPIIPSFQPNQLAQKISELNPFLRCVARNHGLRKVVHERHICVCKEDGNYECKPRLNNGF